MLERLIDLAAERLGIDRVRCARRISSARRSCPTAPRAGSLYDSGDFAGNMKRMVAGRRLEGLCRRADARRRSAASCAASASRTMSRRRSACRTSASR